MFLQLCDSTANQYNSVIRWFVMHCTVSNGVFLLSLYKMCKVMFHKALQKFIQLFAFSLLDRTVFTSPLPECVEDLAVVPDPQQLVGHGDPVGVCVLGVPKDGVRQPDEPHHVAVERQDLHGAVVSESAVGPGLSKDDVDLVLLKQSMGLV